MFDHLLCLDFSSSIILIYFLTEFVQHVINLTVLQALFGRWPVPIKDKIHITIYMNSGWLTGFNGMRCSFTPALLPYKFHWWISCKSAFFFKLCWGLTYNFAFIILCKALNWHCLLTHPCPNCCYFKKIKHWFFALLSSLYRLTSEDVREDVPSVTAGLLFCSR